jgi:outer membrane protein
MYACLLVVMALPAQAEDLLDIYRQALAHDARWAAAQHAYSAGTEKLAQGRATLLPTLNVTGSRLYYDSEIEYHGTTPFVGGTREYDTKEYGANLTQPLYRRQNIALYFQSRAQVGLAEAQLATARSELIVRVAQAYFDVLLAEYTVRLAEAQKAAYTEERDQARARLDAGAVAITDVHESQARLDLAVSQELAARNDLAVKTEGLRRITGTLPGALVPLRRGLVPNPPQPNDIEHWVATADDNNPLLKAQRRNLEVAEREVEKARGAHHPTLDAVAGYTVSSASGSVYTDVASDVRSKSAGVQVQVPLYQGGGTSSREREAVALREKAREDLEDARRALALDTRQAFLAVNYSISQIDALKKAIVSSESQLDATRAGVGVGLRNRVDVLNAEQQLFNVRRDLARAYYLYLLSTLRLQDSAGSLEARHLEEINGLLGREAPVSGGVSP